MCNNINSVIPYMYKFLRHESQTSFRLTYTFQLTLYAWPQIVFHARLGLNVNFEIMHPGGNFYISND